MPRVEIGEVVQDLAGNALTGASVLVNFHEGSAAPVYAAEEGGFPISNPLTTDRGRIEAWVEEGYYDLVVTGRDVQNTRDIVSYTQTFHAIRADTLVESVSDAYTRPGRVLDAPLFPAVALDPDNQLPVNTGAYSMVPSAVKLPDGRIFRVEYTAARHQGRTGKIIGAYSSDEGQSWTVPHLVKSDSTDDIRDGYVSPLSDGRLALTYFQSTVDGSISTTFVDGCKVIFSSDLGLTWSAPVVPSAGFTQNAACSAPIIEHAGKLWWPIYGKNSGDTEWSVRYLTSTDDGVTWSASALLWTGVTDYTEFNLTPCGDGSLLASVRVGTADGNGTIQFKRTRDAGVSWQVVGARLSGLSRANVYRMPSTGSLLMCLREPKLTTHRVFISRDDGESWQGPVVVDGRPQTQSLYAGFVETAPGVALLLYSNEWSDYSADIYSKYVFERPGVAPDGTTASAEGVVGSRQASRATRTAVQSIPNNTDTAISFTANDYDNALQHEPNPIFGSAGNISRFTAKRTGFYDVGGTVEFPANATGRRTVSLRVNGDSTRIIDKNATAGDGSNSSIMRVGTKAFLYAFDYVEVVVNQTSGSSMNLTVSSYAPTGYFAQSNAIGSQVWTPYPRMKGLSLWVAGDQSGVDNGDALATWPDLSGNGHDLLQATAGKRPTLVSLELNQHPVVRFDGVDDVLVGLWDQPAQATMYVVAKYRNSDLASNALTSGGNSEGLRLKRQDATTMRFMTYTGSPQVTTTPESWHIYEVQSFANDNSGFLSVDGDVRVAQTLASGTGVPTSGGLSVGAEADSTLPATVDVAEVIITARNVTLAERMPILRYLGAKYGITVT